MSASNAAPLSRIFRAASVAVVGASRDPTKRGHQAIRALQESGYRGRVYPVNPNAAEIRGLAAVPGVAALPEPTDLALVCTPAATVPAVLEECGRKGVGGAVVLAVGASTGPQDPLESAIRRVRATGLRVLGPNTAGFSNFPLGLNLVGIRDVRPGRLALLTQSGNLGLALIQEAMTDSAAGISTYIGVGNEADLGFDECLAFLGDDPDTDAILMYVEGLRHGRRFVDAAGLVTPRKPVILLKGGRSERGGAAVSSHTGAVAGAYPVFRAAMRAAGVIEVDRSDELFAVGATLAARSAGAARGGVAVLADGGGHATLAIDGLSRTGVPIAALAERTRTGLRTLTGDAAAVENPIDLAGAPDQRPDVFDRALEILLADPDVATVLVSGLFGGYAIRFDPSLAPAEVEAADRMVNAARRAGKPVVVHTLYGSTPSMALDCLRRGGIPVVRSLEVACRCVTALHRRAGPDHHVGIPPSAPATVSRPMARDLGPGFLTEPEARSMVAQYGVPLVPATMCPGSAEAEAAARAYRGPVVLKAVSAHLPHKSDAGGVRLNVPPDQVRLAFDQVSAQVRRHLLANGLPVDLEGALLSPMMPPPVAELLVGVRRDATFGPVVVMGAGGVAVEHLGDVTIRLVPVTDGNVRAALDELSMAPMLHGHRGRPGADLAALARIALGLVACVLDHPELDALEANPVFAYPDHAVVVDVRAALRRGP
ncbi:MAG TPA: acetate--CoA ligase family protein [Gemmatimonadales bacterium]|nr:acetate--CoA ligase family protein [Gemmatimonadales bacterium]